MFGEVSPKMRSQWDLLNFNPINFKLLNQQWNTIQDIAPASSPTFAGLTLSSIATFSSAGTFAANFNDVRPISIGVGGLKATTLAGLQYGAFYTPIFRPTLGATNVAGFNSSPIISAPAGQTITSASAVYAAISGDSNSGTVTNMYGYYFDGSNTDSTQTFSNVYGLYINEPAQGTNKHGGVILGDFAVGTTGQFNISRLGVVNSSANATFNTLTANGALTANNRLSVLGNVTIDNNNDSGSTAALNFTGVLPVTDTVAGGMELNHTFTMTANANVIYAWANDPEFTVNPGLTLIDAIGINSGVGGRTLGAGASITNGYGIVSEVPGYGTNKWSLWSKGVSAFGSSKQASIDGSGNAIAATIQSNGASTLKGQLNIGSSAQAIFTASGVLQSTATNNYVGAGFAIGTTTVAETLTIVDSSPAITITNNSSNGRIKIASSASINYIESGVTSASNSAAPLVFTSMNNGTEWARFSVTGQWLVGTSTDTSTTSKLNVASSTQLSSRLTLTGQEFYQASNTSTDGIAFLAGVNRSGNRQLWIADSAALTQNTTNQTIRMGVGSGFNQPFIDGLATNGTTTLNLALCTNGGKLAVGSSTVPSANLEVRGSAGGLNDYGMFVAEDSSKNGFSMGYDTGNNFSWIYSRSNGVAGRTLNINNCIYNTWNPNNVSFFTAAPSFGSGQGILFLTNAAATPSGNPTGGYFLYATGGAFKGKGTSGTVANIGSADPHCPECGNDYVHEWENVGYQDNYLAICVNCFVHKFGDQLSYTRTKGAWDTHAH